MFHLRGATELGLISLAWKDYEGKFDEFSCGNAEEAIPSRRRTHSDRCRLGGGRTERPSVQWEDAGGKPRRESRKSGTWKTKSKFNFEHCLNLSWANDTWDDEGEPRKAKWIFAKWKERFSPDRIRCRGTSAFGAFPDPAVLTGIRRISRRRRSHFRPGRSLFRSGKAVI